MVFALMIVVGPFVTFGMNQPYGRKHHPVMAVLGAFLGGVMFATGVVGVVSAMTEGKQPGLVMVRMWSPLTATIQDGRGRGPCHNPPEPLPEKGPSS